MSKPKTLKIFDNITDDTAYSKLNNFVEVTSNSNSIIVSTNINVKNNSTITFKAPCDGTGIISLIINSVTYTLVDAKNNNINAIGNVFIKDALVSVLIDTTNNRAYIQNAAGLLDLKEQIGDISTVLDNINGNII